jgi:hypothetical protein
MIFSFTRTAAFAVREGRVRALTSIAALVAVVTCAGGVGAQAASGVRAEGAVPAATGAPVRLPATAVRATTAPTLDGIDNDAVWQGAPIVDAFLEHQPRVGGEPRFRTEVRVAYDDRALYVFARMYDPAPDSIIALLSRRDVRTSSDHFTVVLDSYHDRRTGYEFAVNPVGVKRDYLVYNDSNEDGTWDAIWGVVTRIDSLGWTAEYRLPFSQFRFPEQSAHTFGLMFLREIARTGERVSWPLFRRDAQGFISQAGDLVGVQNIPSPRRLEVTPYVLTKNTTRAVDGGRTHPQQSTMGADLKMGLASNLTLDAAVNPDFGQVEADPSVLNLSAFEQYFEERRPFFLEGAGIFEFRNFCGDIDSGCRGLLYSRRIGRAPQLMGRYGDAASPQQSTILGAAKVTGRTSRGLSVGMLDVVTERMMGAEDRTIEPMTNYAVARVQQDLAGGQSGVGAMVTAVNRSLDEWTTPWLRGEAYTGGLDGRHRFGGRNYEATFSLSGSMVRGDARSIQQLQTDGVHRYQRPDDALSVDSTRTSLAGHAQRVSLSKFGGGVTRFQFVYQRFSAGYETNDLGFQARADEQIARGWYAFQLLKPTAYFRRAFINSNIGTNWSAAGLNTWNSVNTNWHIELPTQWWLHWGVTAQSLAPAYDDRVARGGPAIRVPSGFNYSVGVEGDPRRVLIPTLFIGGRRGDEGRHRSFWVEPNLQFRASSRFSTSLSASWQHADISSQWVRNRTDATTGALQSLFAPLEQTTFSSSIRLNFTATPTLSLQVWGQPYLSTGDYDRLMLPVAPRAAKYADRWRVTAEDGGGFQFREWRSNVVARWEYRPGSTVFLVWQHGRSGYEDQSGRFAFGPEMRDLFGLPPNNTFLLKVSYWLNP